MARKIEDAVTKIVTDRFAALGEPFFYVNPTTWSDRPSNSVETESDPTDIPDNPSKSYFVWGFSTWGGPDLIAP